MRSPLGGESLALIDDAISYAHAEEDKTVLQPLFNAAESYITNAIEQKDNTINEKNPLFCLAVEMLFTHWHDNREPVGKADKIAYGLGAIIDQLQNSGGDENAGGGAEGTDSGS